MSTNPTLDTVVDLVNARRFDDAARRLAAAAGTGDPEALHALATWRIVGDIIRRDLPQARALMADAAAAGSAEAAMLAAGFEAHGLGGAPDWRKATALLARMAPVLPEAARQLRLIEAMDLDLTGSPKGVPGPQPLSDSPYAVTAPGLFTAEECAYLRDAAEPLFRKSEVVDPASGRFVPHPIRHSDGAFFGYFDEDPVIAALNRRIAAFSGTQTLQAEPLQVLRYTPGGQYRAHFDALPAEENQRVLTVLVYLSDDYQGGETHFPRTGLSYRGRTGDALLFRNVTQGGDLDPMAHHAGLSVTRGIKLIASRWIRARPFVFPPPRPLLPV